MKHSPTPWRVIDGDCNELGILDANGDIVAIIAPDMNSADNARYIVWCANGRRRDR